MMMTFSMEREEGGRKGSRDDGKALSRRKERFCLWFAADSEHHPRLVVSAPMRFALLILFLSTCAVLRGQVAIGGKPYVRSMAEAGTKGEWVLYEKGAPQNEGTRRWLTKRVLVELQPGKAAAALGGVAGGVEGGGDGGQERAVAGKGLTRSGHDPRALP
jgi:hypothetical protein